MDDLVAPRVHVGAKRGTIGVGAVDGLERGVEGIDVDLGCRDVGGVLPVLTHGDGGREREVGRGGRVGLGTDAARVRAHVVVEVLHRRVGGDAHDAEGVLDHRAGADRRVDDGVDGAVRTDLREAREAAGLDVALVVDVVVVACGGLDDDAAPVALDRGALAHRGGDGAVHGVVGLDRALAGEHAHRVGGADGVLLGVAARGDRDAALGDELRAVAHGRGGRHGRLGLGVGLLDVDGQRDAGGLGVGPCLGLGLGGNGDVLAGDKLGTLAHAGLGLEVGLRVEIDVDEAVERDVAAAVDLALGGTVVLGRDGDAAAGRDVGVLADRDGDGLRPGRRAHVGVGAQQRDVGPRDGAVGNGGAVDGGLRAAGDLDVATARGLEREVLDGHVNDVVGVRAGVEVADRRDERDGERGLGRRVRVCKGVGGHGGRGRGIARGSAAGAGDVGLVGGGAVRHREVGLHAADDADVGAGGGAHGRGGGDGLGNGAEVRRDVERAGGGERSDEGAEGLLRHGLRSLDVVDGNLEPADAHLGRAALDVGVRAARRGDGERAGDIERARPGEARLGRGAGGGARDVGDRADEGDRQAAHRAVGRVGVGVVVGRDGHGAGRVDASQAEDGLEDAVGLGAGVRDAHVDEGDVDRRGERVGNRVGARVDRDVHGAPGPGAGGRGRVQRDVGGGGAHGGVHAGLAHRDLDADEGDPDLLARRALAAAVDADSGDRAVVGDAVARAGGEVEVGLDAHRAAVGGDGGVRELRLLGGVQVGKRVVGDDLGSREGHHAGAHGGLGCGPAVCLDGEGAARDGQLARADDLSVVCRGVLGVGDVDVDRDARVGRADARGLGLRDIQLIRASRIGREATGGDRGAGRVDDGAVVGGEVGDEHVDAHGDAALVDGKQLGVGGRREARVDGGGTGDGDVLAKDARARQRVIADDEHVGAHRDGTGADAEPERLALGGDVVGYDELAHLGGHVGTVGAHDGLGDLAGHDGGGAHVGKDGRFHGGHGDAHLDGDGADGAADDVGMRGDVGLGADVERADVLERDGLAHEGVDRHVVARDRRRAVDGDGPAGEARGEGRRVKGGVGLDGDRAGDVLDHCRTDDAGIDVAVAHDGGGGGGDRHRATREAKGRGRSNREVRLGLDQDVGRLVEGARDEGVGVAVEAQVGDDRGDCHGTTATRGSHDAHAAAAEGVAHVAVVVAVDAALGLGLEGGVARGLGGAGGGCDLGGTGPCGDFDVAGRLERGARLDVSRGVGMGDSHGNRRADGHGAAGDGEGHGVEEQVARGVDVDAVGKHVGALGHEGADGVAAIDDGDVGGAKVDDVSGLARGGRHGGVQRRVVLRDVVGLARDGRDVARLDVGVARLLVVGADALLLGVGDLDVGDAREVIAVETLVGVVLSVAREVAAQVGARELGVDGLVGVGVGIDLDVVVLAGDGRGVLGQDVRGLVLLVVGRELGGLGVLDLLVGARHVATGVVEDVVDLVGIDLGVGGLEVVARELVVRGDVGSLGRRNLLVDVVLEEQRLEQAVPELVGVEEGDLSVLVAGSFVVVVVALGGLLRLQDRVGGVLVERTAHHGDEHGDAHAYGATGDGGQVHLDVAVARRLDVDVA